MNSPKPLPSAPVLRELLDFDESTGVLSWRERSEKWFRDTPRTTSSHNQRKWNARFAGKPAFTAIERRRGDLGYRVGSLLGVRYKAHRVIYKYVFGEDPQDVDHVNGNTLDNRPSNLRSVVQIENGKNQRRRSTCKSGVMGVNWKTREQKWQARIRVNYQTKHLGYFDSFEDAKRARLGAEKKFGFHENHGKR